MLRLVDVIWVVATILLGLLPACGARTAAMRGEGFVELTTPDIVLRTDLEAPKARKLAADLQSIRAYFASSLFPCSGNIRLPPVRVTVFSRKSDMEALAGENVSGFFQDAPVSWWEPEVVISASRRSGPTLETFAHELTHRMISLCYRGAPPWLHEGLASVFETLRPVDAERMAIGNPAYAFGTGFGSIYIGRGPERIKVTVVPRTSVPDLSELRRMNRQQLYAGDDSGRSQLYQMTLHYAGAWSAVHLLQFGDPELHGRFQAYLQGLRTHATEEDALWDQSFAGIDVNEGVRAYQRRGEFSRMFTARPQEGTPATLRALEPKEAHLHLAELFLRRGRREAWKAHLALAERVGAEEGELELVRGTAAVLGGQPALALRHMFAATDGTAPRAASQAHVALTMDGGLYDAAFDASLERLASDAETAEDFAVLARAKLMQGDPESALAFANRALELNRLCSRCQEIMGHVLLVRSQPAGALQALRAALSGSFHQVSPRHAAMTQLLEGAQRQLGVEGQQSASEVDGLTMVVELEGKAVEDIRASSERCLQALRERDPEAGGEVEVSMRVAASGVVRGADLERSTLGSGPAERCIMGVIRGWQFLSPAWSADVSANHTFVFGGV